MDVLAGPLLKLILTVIDLYVWALIISIVLGWLIHFNVINRSNQFVSTLEYFFHRLTEPALGPIRRVLPNLGGIDLSPIVLILGLYFIKDILIRLAMQMG